MAHAHHPGAADVVIVLDEQAVFSFAALCRASGADAAQLQALVDEGLLLPTGAGPADWQFTGPALLRARRALRLVHELQLGLQGAAVVLDLLAEIDALRAGQRRP